MSPEEFHVLAADDRRAFCEAVCSGNVGKAKSMLGEKPGLARINLPNGLLPIHMAASWGHRQMLMLLFWTRFDNPTPRQKVGFDDPTPRQNVGFDDPTPEQKVGFDDLTWEQKVRLFFTTVKNCIYGKATHFSFFIIKRVLNLKST